VDREPAEVRPHRRATHRAPDNGDVLAALDLGTNNCRLLVARTTGQEFRVIDAFSRIVRLGEGVATNRQLSDSAMTRTIAGLKICAAKMHRRQVNRARCVATEACRQATNYDVFRRRVVEETGLQLDVITTEEEALLALEGCRPLIDDTCDRAIVFDIGGGSTELMWVRVGPGRAIELLGWTSIPWGVVNMTEQFPEQDGESTHFTDMVAAFRQQLEPFVQSCGVETALRDQRVQMLGTSGTVTTLGGVYLGLSSYDRSKVDGLWIGMTDIDRITHGLNAMSCQDRAAVGCVGTDRADLVVAGCAILQAISGFWPVPRLRVADRGIREGLLMSMIRRPGACRFPPAETTAV
jgi:exopolyphosphatase/guanosine-5'-triphosphate,3'-diphosphate pyrophosphatase